MRPTPAEELRALRAIVDSVAGRALDDEFGQGQLRQVSEGMGALAGEWDNALPRLLAENTATEAFLAELATVVDVAPYGDPGRPAEETPFTRANEHHQSLRGRLVRAIRDLDGREEDDAVKKARTMMRAFLLRSAETWTG